MKRRVISFLVSIVLLISLSGCAASVSSGVPQHFKTEVSSSQNSEIKNNLTKIANICAEEDNKLETLFQNGENSDMEDVEDYDLIISNIRGVAFEIEGYKSTIQGFSRTGIDSIDKTYDAAVHYQDMIISYCNEVAECFAILKNIIEAFSLLAEIDTNNANSNYEVSDITYQALESAIESLNTAEYPDYIKSKMNLLVRQLQYYESLVVEDYYASECNDVLRSHAVNNMLGRVEKEVTSTMDDVCDILMNIIEKSIGEEFTTLESELASNIEKLLKAL